jgi:hypothetical protein
MRGKPAGNEGQERDGWWGEWCRTAGQDRQQGREGQRVLDAGTEGCCRCCRPVVWLDGSALRLLVAMIRCKKALRPYDAAVLLLRDGRNLLRADSLDRADYGTHSG